MWLLSGKEHCETLPNSSCCLGGCENLNGGSGCSLSSVFKRLLTGKGDCVNDSITFMVKRSVLLRASFICHP